MLFCGILWGEGGSWLVKRRGKRPDVESLEWVKGDLFSMTGASVGKI
jgi:hypothetical protein